MPASVHFILPVAEPHQNRRSRNEFSTTMSELADMPMAAIQGATKQLGPESKYR